MTLKCKFLSTDDRTPNMAIQAHLSVMIDRVSKKKKGETNTDAQL